ncbi:MAG: hypothetical protein C0391_03140 [Anaerolinea sp.]|nr:hypothetical protein [Anaerolinea sp.]
MLPKLISLKLVAAILVFSVFLGSGIFTPVTQVEASQELTALQAYNRDAAVKWANKNNYNDGRFWGDTQHGRYCTTYVTKAMQVGGIDVPAYTGNVQLAIWLRSHPDYWEFRPKEQLEKGDILFLNNASAIPNSLEISWIDHVVLITTHGKYSAWNAERANKNFSKLSKWKYKKGVHFKVGGDSSIILPTQFLGNPSSRLRDNNGSTDLTVCADNIAGSTVYVLFRRPNGTKNDGTTKWMNWTYSQKAISRCVTFKNLDGAGPLIKGVKYESRAALNQQPKAVWSASNCYDSSNQQGLCNIVRKNQ